MSNEMAPTTKRLTKKQLNELANFVDPATILTQLARHNWTVEKAIENLVQIATDGTKESTRLNAIKYLNTLLIDAMSRSGLMVLATKTMRGEAGEELKFSGRMVSSSLRSQSQDSGADSDETTVDDLIPANLITNEPTEMKEDTNAEEENPKEPEALEAPAEEDGSDNGEDGLAAGGDGDDTVDMCLCKPPAAPKDGTRDAGHFGGIAVSGTEPSPSTVRFL